MQIQSIQTNNNYNNKTSFGALILDKNLKPVLNKLSFNDLQEIKKVREKLKHTKYYDLLVKNNENILRGIEPTFVPKGKNGILLECEEDGWRIRTLEDEEFRESKLEWLKPVDEDWLKHVATFDFATSDDAIRAKNIADKADIQVDYKNYFGRFTQAVKAWGDVCIEVLEKSMAFMASGKPKVLTESEKIVEDLLLIQKDGASQETIDTLRNYFKNNYDCGNLYTADDMLELLKDMFAEDILFTKDILITPIKEGDSSILMYIADIMPTADNSKKYDKILKILSNVQGINYNYKDNNGVSFLEKVMMSENSKLLELIKDKPLEYYPELEYTYKNIQNPEFKEGVKGLNFKLSESDKEIGKSEKIEEKAKSIEEEKPLLASVLKKYSNEEV